MNIVTNIKKLRKISKPIQYQAQAIKILKKLHEMMDELGAICMGLSAVQIGIVARIIHINYRGKVILDLINPVVIKTNNKSTEFKEGCLSLPDTMKAGGQITIKRPKKIKLKFINIDGNFQVLKFDGIIARAILHEIDHLDGKLIIDYE